METIADKSEWIEDRAPGVAIRESGDELHVRATRIEGRQRITNALYAAYPSREGAWPRTMDDYGHYVWIVNSAHRLAFARALSPIAEPSLKQTVFGEPFAGPFGTIGRSVRWADGGCGTVFARGSDGGE